MDKQQFLESVNQFRASRIILSAFELGVFSAIAATGSTSAAVAKQIVANSRATDRLLNALCVQKLVKKKGTLFFLSPFAASHLVKGKPEYMAGLQHSCNLFATWSQLTSVVRTGKPAQTRQSGQDSDRAAGFIAAMHERAHVQAGQIVKLLDLTNVSRTIDIGGGSGAYSIALMQAKPDLKATIFDLPAVIPLCKKYISAAGLQARSQFIQGSFSKDPFGTGYDLALLSAIIHMQSLEKNRRLFSKIFKALNHGGQLVIQDYVMDEARLKPEIGAFFALNMLVNTADGDTFSAGEIKATLQAAGFARIRVVKTPFPAALVIGSKP